MDKLKQYVYINYMAAVDILRDYGFSATILEYRGWTTIVTSAPGPKVGLAVALACEQVAFDGGDDFTPPDLFDLVPTYSEDLQNGLVRWGLYE